jgi:hypothetical protein
MSIEHWWRHSIEKRNPSTQRPVLVLLFPPQLPHGLARGWTRASVCKVEWCEIYGELIYTLTLFSEKKGFCFVTGVQSNIVAQNFVHAHQGLKRPEHYVDHFQSHSACFFRASINTIYTNKHPHLFILFRLEAGILYKKDSHIKYKIPSFK